MIRKHLSFFVLGMVIASSAQAADVKLNGDFRFRHELVTNDNPGANQAAYQRQRISLRVGSLINVNEVAKAEFRLATGNGVTSAWWTLGKDNAANGTSALGNFGINIDRAYFAYTGVSNLTILGGRVKNMLYMAGGSDMIFDSDFNFDEIGATYALPVGDFNVTITGAEVWLNQSEATDTDTLGTLSAPNTTRDSFLSLLQAGARHKVGDIDYGFAAAAYNVSSNYYFGQEYKLVNLGTDVVFKVSETPLAVFVDYVNNAGAAALSDGEDHSNGIFVGAKYGTTKKAGDWMLAYDYRNVKANAVISTLSDGDSTVSPTSSLDRTAHRMKGAYVIADGMTASLTGIFSKGTTIAATPVETKQNKGQLDLTFAF